MRKLFILSLLLIWTGAASAQVSPISNGSIQACAGIFTDSGKEDGTYQANENKTYTICPGTQGGNIRLSFTDIELRPGDLLCFYDGTSSNEPLLACSNNFVNDNFIIQATNQTGCLTAVFVSNAYQQADGWKANISCSPNCQEITAQINSTTPSIQNNNIDICAGTEVQLNASALFPNNNQNYHQAIANCTFKWNFGDGQTAQGQEVSYNFPKGGGHAVSLKITDQYGCESKNSIDLNMRIAEKPTFALASNTIPDLCANKILNLSASADDADADILISQPGGEFSMVKSLSDSLALPDGTGASYVSEIFYNEFNTGQTLTNVADLKNIFVNMEHSWLRDIAISIECPNGQTAQLVHHPGNSGGEVFLGEPNELDEALATPVPGKGYKYEWASNAPNANWIDYINVNNPATLPAGSYQPFEPFSQLIGCPLNGNWKLDVVDSWASDNGYIFAWGLEFDESLYPDGETYKPSIQDIQWADNKLVTTNNGDNIDIESATAGFKSFAVQVTNDFGCVVDTQILVNVLPPTSPNCYDCASFKMELSDTAVCPGQSLDFNAAFNKDVIKALGYESKQNTIIKGATFSNTLTVTNVTPAKIGSVNYRINNIYFTIEASQLTSFDIYIQSPSGKKMVLGNGITINNTQQITFTPKANKSITQATAPFSESYKPLDSWSKLQGEYINGDWKLFAKANNNTNPILINWGINFKNDVSIGYHWTGNGLSCTDCPTPSVSPTTSGQFIVEVYDNLNCAYSDTAFVTIISALAPPVINEPTTEDGKIIFTWSPVNNASSYLVRINNSNWITPNGTLSQTLTGYALGDEISFSVKALSPGGCDGSDANVQLKITDCLLTSNFTVTQAPACEGINDGEVLISATNGSPTIKYALDGGTQNTNGIFASLSTGNHFAIVSDAAGCHDTLVFTLDPLKQLTLNIATTDITCFGINDGTATANLIGGAVNPITYNWQTTQSTQTISNLATGEYGVTATDGNGCQLAQKATITSPEELKIEFENINNITCAGLTNGSVSAKAIGGTAPYAYLWDSGENTKTISNKASGNYTVTITDKNGCSQTGTTTITQPLSALTLTASQTVQGCAHAENNKAIAVANGGVSPYDYVWSNTQNNPIASNLTPGNYSVTVTDYNGCQTSTTLSIAEYQEVIAMLAFTEPKCDGGSDATVSVSSITGGNSSNLADYTFQWLGQSDIDEMIENVPGDRSYYVTVTGTSGCKGVSSILVTQPDPIEIELSSTPVTCAGDKNGTAEIISITGNVGPYDIKWDTKAHGAITNTIADLSGDLYHVTVTNPNGCTGENYIQVEEAQPFQVLATEVINPKCSGDVNGSAVVKVEGGAGPFMYQWSNNSIDNKISQTASGTYQVSITDSRNCQITHEVELVEPTPITSSSTVVDPKCFGENTGIITVSAAGGTGTFEYSLNNSAFNANPIIGDMIAGTYPIYIRDENDCISVDTATIAQPPMISVDAGPNLELPYAELTEISITVDNAVGETNLMVVNPLGEATNCIGCFEVMIEPNYHGEYTFVITDENGCMATDIVDIMIDRNQKFLVPTAFTPNNDEANDYLTCHTKNEAKVNFFRVYDRWGGMIFESTSGVSNQPKEGWDGTSRGEKMPSGTYIWTANVTFDNGVTESFKGQTTLIR